MSALLVVSCSGCALALVADTVGPFYPSAKPSTYERDAAAAARAGDCTTVKAIGARLRARDRGTIRDDGFVDNVDIQRCLIAVPELPTTSPTL